MLEVEGRQRFIKHLASLEVDKDFSGLSLMCGPYVFRVKNLGFTAHSVFGPLRNVSVKKTWVFLQRRCAKTCAFLQHPCAGLSVFPWSCMFKQAKSTK